MLKTLDRYRTLEKSCKQAIGVARAGVKLTTSFAREGVERGLRTGRSSTRALRGHDLRAVLRGGADDAKFDTAIRVVWERRTDRYSELRTNKTRALRKVEMSSIGG